MKSRNLCVPAILFLVFCGVASATEYTSDNFQVLDPVQSSGGYSSSASFRLLDAVAQVAIGTSTSGSYEVRGGFLYFPEPTPTPAAAPISAPTPTPVPAGGGGIPGFGQPPIFKLPSILFPQLPVLSREIKKCQQADFNCDSMVDLADLSVFFYLGGYSPDNNPADLNSDASVDLADASIMFYYWTENKIFNFVRNIALNHMPSPGVAEKTAAPQGFAGAGKKLSTGYQQEGVPEAGVFSSTNYTKTLIIRAVDTIISFLGKIFGLLW